MTGQSGFSWLRSVGALAAAVALTGCNFNVFKPFDSPSGDKQLLSAARAALDRGDYAEALKLYQKLSSSYAEVAASEQAYTTLAQYDAGMTAFATAFGSGGGGGAGKGITLIANDIGAKSGGTARLDIFHAFQQTGRIPDNAPLRGLVRFLTSIALIAEIVNEGAADHTRLVTGDLVSDPTSCAANGATPGCATTANAACSPTGSPVLGIGPTSPIDLNTATDADITAGPTLSLIQSAVTQIGTALGPSEIGAQGNLSGAVNAFTNNPALTTAALATTNGACYRYALINTGIGTY